jgi:hypothetical protein
MLRWLTAILALTSSGAALAQPADVGLVNLVSGAVTFSSPGAPPRPVQAFMKLRDGDQVAVAAGGEMRVVFFASGRQERWAGPAGFRAGPDASVPISGAPAEVTQLPAAVQQRIARVPVLTQYAKLGGIRVRGAARPKAPSAEQQAAVSEARATYEQLRKEAGAEDITPELYLYSALHEFLLYEDMKAVVEEMLRRQPENEDVKALAEWVRSRATR